ncbi:MAG TPA: SMP-30/gluconolactonase/LRE family protein [Polyangia bacterium]|jgi:gluconolactonase
MKCLFAIVVLSAATSCGGGHGTTGAGGAGGGGTGAGGSAGTSGAGSAGAAGAASGAAGATGSAGAAGGNGAAGTGEAGADAGSDATGTAGATGTGGASSAGAWKCPAGTFTAPSFAGLTPQRIASVPPADNFAQGFGILEGPVWVADKLFFTQMAASPRPPPARLLQMVPGAAAIVANADFGANGMALDAQGNLIVTSLKEGSIRRVSPSSPTTASIVASQYMGKRFNGPNDVTIRSDGTIYFSDPDANQSPLPSAQAKPRVYRVSPAGEVSVVDDTIGQPNGVTLSLDEKTLFVNGDAGLFKLAVMPDGSTGPKMPFGNSTAYTGSDGMVVDCADDLYVVHIADVSVLGPTGTELGRLTIPDGPSATNVAFGGADHKTLYITTLGGSPGLYQVTLGVPGMPF